MKIILLILIVITNKITASEIIGHKSFDDTIAINLNGKNIIHHIPEMIENAFINGINLDDLYINDITRTTSGITKTQIILIGKKIERESSRILYILKKIRINLDDPDDQASTEIDSIKNAYQNWAQRRTAKRFQKAHKDGVIRANIINQTGDLKTYKMKLAWHEHIFHDPRDLNVYYELLHAAQGKLLSDYNKIPVVRNHDEEASVSFESNEDIPILIDRIDWEKSRIAYEALGAVLGAFFKEYQLSHDDEGLDLHHNNLFFNEVNNTITWIDLQWLGVHFSGKVSPGKRPGLILAQALNHEWWGKFFMQDALFAEGIKKYFPSAKDPKHALHPHLINERDRLFNNIQCLYESFANAFIQNYNPDDEFNLKEYFKKTFIFPFNNHPKWFTDETNFDEESLYSDFFMLEQKTK